MKKQVQFFITIVGYFYGYAKNFFIQRGICAFDFFSAKHFFSLLFTFLTISVFSQTTIWEEDFTYADGTTVGTGNRWTLSGSANGHFNVQSNRLEASDTDADDVFWLSESISISGYTNVTINFDGGEDGDCESGDHIIFWYRIDGGTGIEVEEQNA